MGGPSKYPHLQVDVHSSDMFPTSKVSFNTLQLGRFNLKLQKLPKYSMFSFTVNFLRLERGIITTCQMSAQVVSKVQTLLSSLSGRTLKIQHLSP